MREIKEYVDLKVDEFKLKITQGLSLSFARITSIILILNVSMIVMGLFAFASVSWLSRLVGSLELASTIMLGVFVVVLIVLIANRKKMFRNTFVSTFIKIFYSDDK